MPKSNLELYREYHELYGRAHPNLSKGKAHDEVNLKWNSLKKDGKCDLEAYNKEILALKSKLAKRKLTMFDFANNKVARTSSLPPSTSSAAAIPDSQAEASVSTSSHDSGGAALATSDVVTASPAEGVGAGDVVDCAAVEEDDDEAEVGDKATRDTPAQAKIKEELQEVNARLVKLNEARNLGLGEETNASLVKQIKDVTIMKDALQKKLKVTEQWRKNSKKARDKKKLAIKRAETDFPGLADRMKSIQRDSPGRPPIEEDYPNLHRDILEIATIGAAASDRRREETFRSVKTLGDLHHALADLGYHMSKSALYLRLLPKGISAAEAKRHVRTVPVRFVFCCCLCVLKYLQKLF